jgi:adenine C2-methylase RlmN of 23S rRNA A2503 and tRNA A37
MIPCNDIGLDDFKRPSNEDIVAYKEILHREKYSHSVRLTRGEEDASACGMLATSRKPKTELDMQISDIREELPSTEDEYNSDM